MFRFRPKTYIKDESNDPFFKEVNWRFYIRMRLMPVFLMFLSVVILTTQVFFPLYVFKTQDEVSKPARSTVLGVVTGYSEFTFNELQDGSENESDAAVDSPEGNVPEFYTITMPRLGIKDALVETNPPDLNPDEALGHYIGTAMPGTPGNSFVYGHSVLPVFYNPRNYKTIFSTLGDMQVGDAFTVNYNNVIYTYKVESKSVLKPNEVNPRAEIKPKYLNESTMVLMTCWPAGLKTNRLLVSAVLVNN